MAATSDATSTPAEPAKPATTSKTGASNSLSKKRALLSTLASSTKPKADMADALEDTAAAPPSVAAADALEQHVDAGIVPIYTGRNSVPVQCTFSQGVGGEGAMPSVHDDLVVDVEGASDQNVRAPSTKAEEQGEIAGPLGALEKAAPFPVDHSVTSLCSHTPPSSQAQGEPAVEVEEAGVSLNPDVVDAVREGLAALAVEAAEMERVDEPLEEMEEKMVAMPLLQDRHHPLEYIPPFAREDVFC